MKNIIILTSGLSGSSVVTHLISKAGYWLGDSTCQKSDYNTYENSTLVGLNKTLLQAVNYDREYSVVARLDKVLEVEQLINSIDLQPFNDFLDQCEQSGPWIWKDPRLWVTMPFWMHLLDPEMFQVVIVDRSTSQRWISELLRRNVQTLGYCSDYNATIRTLIDSFVVQFKIDKCELVFDDLIKQPEKTIIKINQFLECSLDVDDLQAIYKKPLYQKTRGIKSLFLAVLIYLKNYRDRLR